jgi:dimethylargininase
MMKHAIVRPPPVTFSRCISSHPLHHELNLSLALSQHQEYCNTLIELGLDLIELPVDEMHPDSSFVEDIAIVHKERAVITRMAKESRRGEDLLVQDVLQDYKHLRRIEPPGTIEGGDVIHLDASLISGITERTNPDGVFQASSWLVAKFEVIEDLSIIHLKSHVTALDNDTFVVTERYADHPLLREYRRLIIPRHEEYAANTLTINGTTLMSSQHVESVRVVQDAGFDVITLDMSEFEKCEGAITCLSILF